VAGDPARTLPDAFPSQPARPSELWAQLRALALGRAGRYRESLRQAERLDTTKDPRSAEILATALADTGQMARAAALPDLDEWLALGLLHLDVNDASLAALAKGVGPRAAPAAEVLAGRRLGNGDWLAGARILDAAAPAQARYWREAARRAADRTPAGRLVLARWLLENEGRLFLANYGFPDRSLNARLDTGLSKPQFARLSDWLLRGGERQRALEAYGAALAAMDPAAPEAAETLKEADRLYNRLLDWDTVTSGTYNRLLSETPAARRIRAFGKAVRARLAPGPSPP
jgi:hypothetical protein